MTNNYKTSANTVGLNVEGNEITLSDGSLAVADNAIINRDNIIEQRFGFDRCDFFIPASKPESMFVTGDTLYVHVNNQLWYLKFPDDCIYSQILGSSAVSLESPISIFYYNGFIFFTQANDIVRKINLNDLSVITAAGLANTPGTANGIGSIARFNFPIGVYFNNTYCYICDSNNYTIRRLDISTNNVTTIAGTAGASAVVDGIGAAARFSHPYSMWSDNVYIYITDNNASVIRRLEIATNDVVTIAGTAFAIGGTDGIGASARFLSPKGIWGDGNYLYITDVTTIRKLEIATNNVTTIAGLYGSAAITDGTGTAARFRDLFGITGDSLYLYVSDSGVCLRKINKSTIIIDTFAGSMTAGDFGSIDGNGLSARFNGINGLTNDTDYIYGCDFSNSAIRRISKLSNDVSYFAGNFTITGNQDGVILSILSGPNG